MEPPTLLFLAGRSRISQNSKTVAQETGFLVRAIQESLGSIRDIILDSSQQAYLQNYKKHDILLRFATADSYFLAGLPRFIIETLGISLIVLFIASSLVLDPLNTVKLLPTVGAFALGSQRLLPCLQQIYSSWSQITSSRSQIQYILNYISENVPQPSVQATVGKYEHKDSIVLESVSFAYSDGIPVFTDLNITIKKGEIFGIVGPTGCGKSTFIDIISGLLRPTAGRILIDGTDLHHPENKDFLKSWMTSLAHVPQEIYLVDSTIADNIALSPTNLNFSFDERIEKAAGIAQLKSFIDSSPNGYLTKVGERGVMLSGGQRQRIGIARAVFRDSKVLILDEATSALDNQTQHLVMSALANKMSSRTIVMISHRKSTLNFCSEVLDLGDFCAKSANVVFKHVQEPC